MVKWFDKLRNVKRRGDSLPGRLRFSSRRGVTLVELMISMLILAIVCISWLKIIGIQSARKEARRREAVERLAGMMDAFMYMIKTDIVPNAYYHEMSENEKRCTFKIGDASLVYPMFNSDVSPIGYQLCVVEKKDLPKESFFKNWDVSCRYLKGYWLIGRLYNTSACSQSEAGNPFFELPVCLGL